MKASALKNKRRELSRLYQKELSKEIEVLEKLRAKAKKEKTINYIGIGLCIIGFLSLSAFNLPFLGIPLIIVGGICIFLTYLKPAAKEYTFLYKHQVVAKIFALIIPEVNYKPRSSISLGNYTQSGLFIHPDRYSGDDLATMTIDKTDLEISELHAEKKHEYYDKNGHRNESWSTIFRGFFVVADFHKNFIGSTYVLPDFIEKNIGFLSKITESIGATISNRGDLVKLENIDFEKEFKVYSNDQVTARYILTPQMMEGLLKLKKVFKHNVHLSFINGKVYIAIEQYKNNFEPNIFSKSLNYSIVLEIYSLLENILSIVEHMSLNTRIWTKK